MITKEITTKEWELVNTIRNYRKAYPNGARMFKAEINELLDILMDIQYYEEEENENNQEE